MRPKHLIEALKAILPTGQSVWIHGPPGIGKTDIGVHVTDDSDMHLWRFPPTVTIEPVDVRGLPNIQDGRTVWAHPDLWPDKDDVKRIGKKIVVFLDELPQGATAVQAALMQAVHSKRIGGMELPPDLVFLACGNRQEDRAGANRVITPLLNRFLHLDLEVSNDDWQEWAMGESVAPEVRGFLNFRPALLHQFDPSRNERAFPTPRSWHYVSNILPACPSHLVHPLTAGLVGEGPAAEFTAFVQTYRDLPDLDACLKKPDTTAVPKGSPAVMYALCTALSEKSRGLDSMDALATYAMRFDNEFSALCLRDSFSANCKRNKQGGTEPHPKLYQGKIKTWYSQHRDVLYSR